jgi:hypothetical protein
MSRQDGSRRGGFWRIDDRTGFRVRGDESIKEWTGAIVARGDYEPRHPQDFVRGKADRVAVPDPRSEPADTFQAPAGGPFMLVQRDSADRAALEIIDGDITIYGGRGDRAQPSPSDF